MALWRNWHTHRLVKPAPDRDCGFEPRQGHVATSRFYSFGAFLGTFQ